MKKIIFILVLWLFSIPIYAQGANINKSQIKSVLTNYSKISLNGYYSGTLLVSSTIKLPIIFEFKDNKVFFSSPSQNANDLEIQYQITNKSDIEIQAPQFGFYLKGKIKYNKIDAIFYQSGLELPITLNYFDTNPFTKIVRKQEPRSFDYKNDEVIISNKNNDRQYFGTLTIPNENRYRTAILFITGSGVQDRNEEIANHKPFLIISNYLTKNGYYTLRCDDWGYHGENVIEETTQTIAEDIKAQITYLRQNENIDKIILLGHSEGALVAQMLANSVDSIILMGSPSVNGREIYKFQLLKALNQPKTNKELVNKIDKITETVINNTLTIEDKKAILIPFFKSLGNDDKSALTVFNTLNLPWYKTYFKIDPKDYISKIKVPTLILQGSLDTQVDVNLNIPVFKEFLNCNYSIKIYENYNHLFQKCKTGETKEYFEIETTIEENVLKDILEFINSLEKDYE
ncbi:MAG: alpha/beta hydrolase [Pleomorphochaeta sp.]